MLIAAELKDSVPHELAHSLEAIRTAHSADGSSSSSSASGSGALSLALSTAIARAIITARGGSALKLEVPDHTIFQSLDSRSVFFCAYLFGFLRSLTSVAYHLQWFSVVQLQVQLWTPLLFARRSAVPHQTGTPSFAQALCGSDRARLCCEQVLYLACDDIVGLETTRNGAGSSTFDVIVTVADSLSAHTQGSAPIRGDDSFAFAMIPKAAQPRLLDFIQVQTARTRFWLLYVL
jgi:hypothetical protein